MSSSTERDDDLRVEGPRKKQSFVRRLLADTQGTATTETVIMIPMFAVVWGCIFFVFTFFQRTIQMRSITRRDTWIYAYTSCETRGAGGSNPTSLECESSRSFGGDSAVEGGQSSRILSSLLSFIPGFNFNTAQGSRTASVTRPTILGGGSLNLQDRLWILENEQPKGVLSFVADLIMDYIGF